MMNKYSGKLIWWNIVYIINLQPNLKSGDLLHTAKLSRGPGNRYPEPVITKLKARSKVAPRTRASYRNL